MITGLAGQQHARLARRAARQLTCLVKPAAGPAQAGRDICAPWGACCLDRLRPRPGVRCKSLGIMRPVSTVRARAGAQ
jgi:hypothetical protein